jgi:hypothetical protein
MSDVEEILAPRGRISAIARNIKVPVGTVWCWRKNGSIPIWRRMAVLEAVKRLEFDIPDSAITYLAKPE